MSYPFPIKHRLPIDALTGIKSSLSNIRQVISLTYLLYVVSGKKAFVEYCDSVDDKLLLKPELLASIKSFFNKNDIDNIINSNPLLIIQYEPLYVGMTLLFRLANLKMNGRTNTAERTGGLRFPKQISYASNIVLLDLILSGFPDEILKKSLLEWLNNQHSSNADFENKVCSFLSICTAFTQFKIRDTEGKEIFFQTEGIYQAINAGQKGVNVDDSKESVGPTRIYKNIIKEGLEPWIKQTEEGFCFSEFADVSPKDFSQILSTTLDIYNVKDESVPQQNNNITQNDNDINLPLQQIYYGTPGSGKSHKVKDMVEAAYPDKDEREKYVFRTTFHPDSDYASFVGCYKPQMKDGAITYEFVPQSFTKAYVQAWNEPEKQIYLIVEEINRGNCAQIFGDLFQLLDRKNGVSEYPIDADDDLRQYLEKELNEADKAGIANGKIKLPANLNILATMNTSDQSLFPMDSAFKRRWNWECVPIDYNNPKSSEFRISIGDQNYKWLDFLKNVNTHIFNTTGSEDKQMGNFFIDSNVDERQFVNKVMFYLWNDVCKDEVGTKNNFFRNYTNAEKDESVEFSFNDLFSADASHILAMFMEYLDVKADEAAQIGEEPETDGE